MNQKRLQQVLENMKKAGLEQIIVTETEPVYYLTGIWVAPLERMMAVYIHSCLLYTSYSSEALKSIANIEKLGQDKLPICMAKTQYSLSDDPSKLGRPTGFKLNIRDVKLSAGAGFIVALSGTIMTMPGLGKDPAAYRIDIDEDGHIHGLF